LSDAVYLRLYAGTGNNFLVAHHFNPSDHIMLSMHSWHEPEKIVGQCDVRGWGPAELVGPPDLWASVPRAYVGSLNDAATGASGYYLVRLEHGQARIARLDWFDDDLYDHGYQGVLDVAEVAGGQNLVFTVQRSSELVICAASTLQVLRRVGLANRGGNPDLVFEADRGRVWVTDYDTIVRLDVRTWTVQSAMQLQEPTNGAGMFIGDPWVGGEPRAVVVPRPGSGDVLVLDPDTLTIRGRAATGGQPLSAALLPTGTVVARDWQSGEMLSAPVGTAPDARRPRRRLWPRKGEGA
jgi:hypothetical protein